MSTIAVASPRGTRTATRWPTAGAISADNSSAIAIGITTLARYPTIQTITPMDAITTRNRHDSAALTRKPRGT